eukprot:5442517-Heterocapsa_arctica.AAC.1
MKSQFGMILIAQVTTVETHEVAIRGSALAASYSYDMSFIVPWQAAVFALAVFTCMTFLLGC